MIRLALLLPLLLWLLGAAPAGPPPEVDAEARALERRLLAPCCYRETLDTHQSPGATELRAEIRRRLAAGESAAAIEGSLVARHGARVRATLPSHLGYLLVGAPFAAGFALLLWLGRRRAPRPQEQPAPPEPLADEERRRREDQLDDELALADG